jgi:hypothetical protein
MSPARLFLLNARCLRVTSVEVDPASAPEQAQTRPRAETQRLRERGRPTAMRLSETGSSPNLRAWPDRQSVLAAREERAIPAGSFTAGPMGFLMTMEYLVHRSDIAMA